MRTSLSFLFIPFSHSLQSSQSLDYSGAPFQGLKRLTFDAARTCLPIGAAHGMARSRAARWHITPTQIERRSVVTFSENVSNERQ
jgi:hypothetical protein